MSRKIKCKRLYLAGYNSLWWGRRVSYLLQRNQGRQREIRLLKYFGISIFLRVKLLYLAHFVPTEQ